MTRSQTGKRRRGEHPSSGGVPDAPKARTTLVVRFAGVATAISLAAFAALSAPAIQAGIVHKYCVFLAGIVRAAIAAVGIEAYGTGAEINTANARLSVVTGCSGLDVSALVVAAIIAFPGSWKRRAAGAAVAVLVIGLVNVVRITVLALLAGGDSKNFQDVHVIYAQGAMILFAISLWVLWVANWSAYANPTTDRLPR